MKLVAEAFSPRRQHHHDIKRNIVRTDPVYRVVDADTGRVLDDNKGFGFVDANKTLAEWTRRVNSASFKVRSWLEAHPSEGALLFERYFDAATGRLGDVAIDDKFFAEILEPFGLEAPLLASTLRGALDKLIDKYANGEICNDHSLADEYRIERARDVLAKGIAMTGGPKLTVIEGKKERQP